MGFPLEKTPPNVKVRIWGHSGCFYVLKRISGWECIAHYKDRKSAAARVDHELQLMNRPGYVPIIFGPFLYPGPEDRTEEVNNNLLAENVRLKRALVIALKAKVSNSNVTQLSQEKIEEIKKLLLGE